MKISEAISIVESYLDYEILKGWEDTDEIIKAFDTLIDSGIKQLALEMKINELEVELDRCRTKEVYSGF